MAANEIHIGDIGTIFEVTLMDNEVVVPIDAATLMEIIFVKPDKTKVVNTAVLTSDGLDGKMQYVIALASELDTKGGWKIQGRVVLPTGTWSTDIDKFKVYENL
jgi:hypothetical protein